MNIHKFKMHHILGNNGIVQLADNSLRSSEHNQITHDIMTLLKEFGAEINYNKDHWSQFCCYDLSLKNKFK